MRKPARVSWRDVDKRMRRAVQLRQSGLSLRQIADRLGVDASTIHRDLQRWEQGETDKLLLQLGVAYGTPPPGMQHSDATDRRMQ